jgi:hypothetical protein
VLQEIRCGQHGGGSAVVVAEGSCRSTSFLPRLGSDGREVRVEADGRIKAQDGSERPVQCLGSVT